MAPRDKPCKDETGYFWDYDFLNYNNLVYYMSGVCDRIETPVIDDALVTQECIKTICPATAFWLDHAGAAELTSSCTQLQRLVAHVESFAASKKPRDGSLFKMCRLESQTLRSIEMIQPDSFMRGHIHKLAEKKQTALPRLAEVIVHRASSSATRHRTVIRRAKLQAVGVELKMGLAERDLTLLE
ncbi:hypothetical protein E8E12_011729 [Didymella heteroderae]|uniref:Uncharacterized protein n=1 Tax=Didymella heteroderae TaxID=1769908 RepID=A0A9P4X222_9PLEO|nr:hypothetical protein E8E12_011729 [Didymella heteroderae]